MQKYLFLTASITVGFLFLTNTNARSKEFGGYECTDDCSGHAAGYRWAEEHNMNDPLDCPLGRNSQSFYEGCMAYTEDPARGADEDDDGDPVD